jgi:hypothetical protein
LQARDAAWYFVAEIGLQALSVRTKNEKPERNISASGRNFEPLLR